MEEILASIRRIIADDQEGAKAEAAAPRPARPAPPPEPEFDEDDVLDLAEVAEPAKPALPTLDLEHEDVAFGDVDPNQIDFDSLDVGEPEPEPSFEEPEQGYDEPEEAYDPPPPPVYRQPEPEPRGFASLEDRLISGATDAAVGQAFNMLAHTVLTNNARTLEDLVKEMLKPMLKVWLDDNLPPLVERLVRAEIERVARGSR